MSTLEQMMTLSSKSWQSNWAHRDNGKEYKILHSISNFCAVTEKETDQLWVELYWTISLLIDGFKAFLSRKHTDTHLVTINSWREKIILFYRRRWGSFLSFLIPMP